MRSITHYTEQTKVLSQECDGIIDVVRTVTVIYRKVDHGPRYRRLPLHHR